MIWSAVGTKVAATLLCAYGLRLVTPIGWMDIALIWAYSITWSFLTDWAKIAVYGHMGMQTPRHRRFLDMLWLPLHARAEAKSVGRRI